MVTVSTPQPRDDQAAANGLSSGALVAGLCTVALFVFGCHLSRVRVRSRVAIACLVLVFVQVNGCGGADEPAPTVTSIAISGAAGDLTRSTTLQITIEERR